jgi:hypothetical protein
MSLIFEETQIATTHAVRNLFDKEADSSEIIDAIKRQYDLLATAMPTFEKQKMLIRR